MADVAELTVRAIEGRLNTNITSIDAGWTSADNVAWPGTDFDPGTEDWMRPTVLFADPEWGTYGPQGTGRNLVQGILQGAFFARPGSGFGALRGYVAEFRELFDRASIAVSGHGNCEFGPAGGPREGPFDGSWLQLIVDCPFTVEEHGS